jgi:hypothetical protein
MNVQFTQKQRFLEAADRAETNAAVMTDPTVKDTMLSLASLYRKLAEQIEELEWLRRDLIAYPSR